MNEQQQEPERLPQSEATPSSGEPQGKLYQPTQPQTVAEPPAQSQYAGYELASDTQSAAPPVTNQSVSWEASEYVHHSKGASWIAGLVGVSLVLIAIAIWTGAWTFVALIVVMSVAMGVVAFRSPRVLRYNLNDQGLQVDEHFYDFTDFRAFGVLGEGAFYTIMLLPTKRFMPAVHIYFAEQDGEKIVDILGAHLPMEHLEQDPVEKLMRRLRF